MCELWLCVRGSQFRLPTDRRGWKIKLNVDQLPHGPDWLDTAVRQWGSNSCWPRKAPGDRCWTRYTLGCPVHSGRRHAGVDDADGCVCGWQAGRQTDRQTHAQSFTLSSVVTGPQPVNHPVVKKKPNQRGEHYTVSTTASGWFKM